MMRDARHLTGAHARVQVLRPGVRGLSIVAEARRRHVQRCALARPMAAPAGAAGSRFTLRYRARAGSYCAKYVTGITGTLTGPSPFELVAGTELASAIAAC